MKKMTITAAAMAALMILAGCGSSTAAKTTADPSAATTEETEMTGAYTVNADLSAAKLPDDAQNAFEKAMDGLTGVDYEPIALLGRQIVSGTNYAILCKSTVVYPDAQPSLSVVTVYEDLQGNASILSITDFDLSEIAGESNDYQLEEGVAGAFETNTEYTAETISETAQNAFDKAMEGLTGASYDLAAELGEQVVSGTNYAFLTLETPAVQDPESKWAVVTVYEDLDGNSEISSVYELDPGAFTDYSQASASADAQ